nr:hypothetical protein [Tanacetum cinerariifolium]
MLLFSIGNDKAPRTDGYTLLFFKETWDIVRVMFVMRLGTSSQTEMEDPDITMEEYVQYETEKSLGIAIIYDDALSSQHVDEVNWNNETSLSKYCDENVIS